MVDLRGAAGDYLQAGIHLVMVMMGEVEQVAAIKKKFHIPFLCLADPDQFAYQEFEIVRGSLSAIAGPRVWLPGQKAPVRGGMGKPGDDVFQLHGSFAIDQTGIVQLAHHPQNSADHVTFDHIVAALG
ncbi:MAG: hypothetical protein QGH11_08290 [Pirellulaceae bacterium]|nr:hypothetical protein [Pirellulaceae bacterium]